MKKYTDAQLEDIGEAIGIILNIPRERSSKRFKTTWGIKTGLGLIKTIERMIDDVKKGKVFPQG